MFYRKLVALLLLGFYGIPAALGPHWHHHGCAEQACVSQNNTPEAIGSQPASVHHCSCQHHRHTNSVEASKQKIKPLAWSEDCGQSDGPCAICAFYASAQLLPLDFEIASQCELVSMLDLLEPSVPSTSRSAAQARGPPSLDC